MLNVLKAVAVVTIAYFLSLMAQTGQFSYILLLGTLVISLWFAMGGWMLQGLITLEDDAEDFAQTGNQKVDISNQS